MLGFQDQEDGVILENEERSVGSYYVSTAVFGSATYSTSFLLQRITSSSKSSILNFSFHIEAKIFGFQDQEDWTLVENEEHSVGSYYVSTA